MVAHFVDKRFMILLLGSGKGSGLCVFQKGALLGSPSLGLGYGRNKISHTPKGKNLLCGLAVTVQFPMLRGAFIGRVQDGVLKKKILRGHVTALVRVEEIP